VKEEVPLKGKPRDYIISMTVQHHPVMIDNLADENSQVSNERTLDKNSSMTTPGQSIPIINERKLTM
jgi:hypothetical protein